jgi:purine-nucleoside phosphorylase
LAKWPLATALELGITLREGVYLAGLGPSYETKAEVRMLQFLGADVVGMSTVIETVAARHAGLKVLGFTLVSNSLVQASAMVTHEEVMEAGQAAGEKFGRLVKTLVGRI